MRYESAKGLAVTARRETKRVGTIDELLVDPVMRAVRWLRLSSAADGKHDWLTATAVRALDESGATINSESDVEFRDATPQARAVARRHRRVVGAMAVTDGGTPLGEIGDYEFAANSYALVDVIVSASSAGNAEPLVIPERQILAIGEAVVVVSDDAASRSASLPSR